MKHFNRKSRILLRIIILLTCHSCTNPKQTTVANYQSKPTTSNETYVIRNVTLIPMTIENKLLEHATVVIQNNKIFSINDSVPVHATTIDGTGKWLLPGLVDMHVHNLADINLGDTYPTKGATLFTNTQDFMLLYLANGVTTAFELSARVEHFAQRNEIIKGDVIGPRIALAMLVEGEEGSGNRANTPAEGRQTVRLAKAQGYEFIKLYSRLNIETYKAIIEEANKQGMKVVGHIPNVFKGRLGAAFIPHFDMVAHAEEYAKQTDSFTYAEAQRFARLAKQNNTWLTATLVTMERIAAQARSLDMIRNLPYLPYIHPLMQSKWLTANNYHTGATPERIAYFEKLTVFHRLLVKAFKEAGVPIVAGTDAGTSGVVWGFALHDELELLVKAGLTPGEALASATRLPAEWLQLGDRLGTVESGKYADLLLLDANPLENISNTRKIAGVFANGRWVTKQTIDTMLKDLATRNNRNLSKFDWKKRTEL